MLQETAPASFEVVCADLPDFDIRDAHQLQQRLAEIAPHLVINAAAYTAVDAAEAQADIAEAVNATAVAGLAEYCAVNNARLVHVSTDFVFDGSQTRPIDTHETPAPQSVYGRTKLAGEQAVTASGADARVVRTSWLYSEYGSNFVKTMLRLAQERDELSVVNDEIGSPTYTRNLVVMIWSLVAEWPAAPLLHYSDAGETSWHGFADAVFGDAVQMGLLDKYPTLHATTGAAYGAPAARPAYSVLDTSETSRLLGIKPPQWRDGLREMLIRLQQKT